MSPVCAPKHAVLVKTSNLAILAKVELRSMYISNSPVPSDGFFDRGTFLVPRSRANT